MKTTFGLQQEASAVIRICLAIYADEICTNPDSAI